MKRMLIDPFVDKGHEYEIFFSTYPFTDSEIEKSFYDTVKPNRVQFSNLEGSDAFTTKYASFENFVDRDDLDLIVFCRNDMHFSKVIAEENVDYKKFNFLFKESGCWDDMRFSTDNFYIFPQRFASFAKEAVGKTYCWPRGAPHYDTHGLYTKLIEYISEEDIHFISETHEFSDVNSFYTLCRTDLPSDGRGIGIHPEVLERFYK
jgi:hypothetical protein